MGTSILKHVHLNECDSTQDVLKEQLTLHGTGQKLLVSCVRQRSGRGRGSNVWYQMAGTICFSLNLEAHPVMSFTAIEIAVLVAEFFQHRGQRLRLKWPNDLWTSAEKKCGGILVQAHGTQFLAGVGLNLTSTDAEFGGIYSEGTDCDQQQIVWELCNYIHEHRIVEADKLRSRWEQRCGHLGKTVQISEAGRSDVGVFQGLGEFGEALLQTPEGPRKFYNGSLSLTVKNSGGPSHRE